MIDDISATRGAIVDMFNQYGLDEAAGLFGTSRNSLKIHEDYLGCQNIVYDYHRDHRDLILRISYRYDRPYEQIMAEVHFISYLADNGALVSRAVPSVNGNLVESIQVQDKLFFVVSFIKGKGVRVPDNNYRYREDAPIEEYFQNWGRTLGKIHALSKDYKPLNSQMRRPNWLSSRTHSFIDNRVPDAFPVVRQNLKGLVEEASQLPKDRDSYGLIHADFNDGNFTVDYSNGDITVFDFDDICYNWFMYDLACAWEGGVGRTMFEADVEVRKDFMRRYFDVVMTGYNMENKLPNQWLQRLPFFLKMVEMDSLLEYFGYNNQGLLGEEDQGRMKYLVYCVKKEIPYLGLFDSVYSSKRPFVL